MYFYNSRIAKKIDSVSMKATAQDSFADMISTFVVIVSIICSKFTTFPTDALAGIFVALFILYTGIESAKETIKPLLGTPPSKEFVNQIEEEVCKFPHVVGIHDLIVHDYGPGRCIISLHAEVPQDEDILKAHDAIDLIEKQLQCKFNCEATIHMDPIAADDDYTVELRESIEKIILDIDASLSIHDFRIVKGNTHTNVIFDLVIPHKFCYSDKEIISLVRENVRELDDKLVLVIHIDKIYINSSSKLKC